MTQSTSGTNKSDNHEPTLCFDCNCATKPWACCWVDRCEPVPGWAADLTTVSPKSSPYHSYHVRVCPNFRRDAYRGGVMEHHATERVKIDNNDTTTLAGAICERAVVDWIALDYGRLQSAKCDGSLVQRRKLLEFFFSTWFEELLASFSRYTPAQIRRAIRIPGRDVNSWNAGT